MRPERTNLGGNRNAGRDGEGRATGTFHVIFCSLLYSFLLLALLFFQLFTVQQQTGLGETQRNQHGRRSNAGRDRGAGGREEEVEGRAEEGRAGG